jgi:transcription antitermination factor NusG
MKRISRFPHLFSTSPYGPKGTINLLSDLPESRWYALYVRSQHEKSVLAQLEAKQHEAFLPLYESTNKWADRWKSVALPLFPGYVFCRFKQTQRTSVLATSGVVNVVKFGPDPASIPQSEIEAVRLIVNSRVMAEPYTGLGLGEEVTMSAGPLRGLTGILTDVRKSPRLVVSIDLLNRSVSVEVDRAWVVPRPRFDSAHQQFPGPGPLPLAL